MEPIELEDTEVFHESGNRVGLMLVKSLRTLYSCPAHMVPEGADLHKFLYDSWVEKC